MSMRPLDLRQLAIHEIGHAFILLTCGAENIELTHATIFPSDPTNHGSIGFMWKGLETDFEGLSMAWTLEEMSSRAMIAVGGIVAEQVHGYQPNLFGGYSDIVVAGMTIACLSGASRDELLLMDRLLCKPIPLADSEELEASERFEANLNEFVAGRCGRSLNDLYALLIQETRQRLSMCDEAVGRLVDALLEQGELNADEIHEILRRTPWCGVLGAPVITQVFSRTWPSKYVNEVFEGWVKRQEQAEARKTGYSSSSGGHSVTDQSTSSSSGPQ